MEIAMVVETTENNNYRAAALAAADLVAEAPSRESALEELRKRVRERFSHAELIHLDVSLPGVPHPWMALAGTWKDHADATELERAMRDYRQAVDANPLRP